MRRRAIFPLTFALILFLAISSYAQVKPLGIFDGQSEVGPVKLKGGVNYNAKAKQYSKRFGCRCVFYYG
ncbi:hypothetical protein [Mucilaginibacter sp.]|uniref:hypothetical protein n=1 Tax=Mucilaginibacter sp. TaxID=1882438 RepID=UPI0032644D2B